MYCASARENRRALGAAHRLAPQERAPLPLSALRRAGRFLDDPERQTWVLKAVQADRDHVEDSIRRAESDLDTMTDRRGRPYSLICTKNQASYERRAKQRKQDLRDLALLTG